MTTAPFSPLGQRFYVDTKYATAVASPTTLGVDPTASLPAELLKKFGVNKARIHRWRGIVGLNYRYEILYVAGQFMTDLTDPSAENDGLFDGKQWTTVFEAGVFF